MFLRTFKVFGLSILIIFLMALSGGLTTIVKSQDKAQDKNKKKKESKGGEDC